MKTLPTVRVLGLASLSMFAAASTLAQDTSHYYGGVSVGLSRTDINVPGITTGLVPSVVSAPGATTDEKDTAYKLFGGYQFNRNIALEGGYFNLGKSSFYSPTVAGSLSGETKVHGINLDLVGTLPLTERLSALGRIGAQHSWSRSNFTGTGDAAGGTGSLKHNDGDFKVGLGFQYEISRSMWVRAEVERYRLKDAVGQRNHVTVASMSLVIPFGRVAQAPIAASPQYPVYVAPAPAPAPQAPPPVVIAAPPPPPAPALPVRQRVSMSADTLFGFDQSTVRANTDLANFKKQVEGTRIEAITVEGHTDRIGSADYNQTLSVERAEAVKSYLVIHGAQDPGKITAVGKGESQPVTQAADCSDRLPHNQLIACLQPDRRVEVEVTGTR